MSLDFRLTKIENYQEKCWIVANEGAEDETRELNPITQRLVFATMAVGLGEITEKNWQEFYARMHVVECTYAPTWEKTEPADVKAHIGLHTNVFPNESRAKWGKRFLDNELDRHMRLADLQVREIVENT